MKIFLIASKHNYDRVLPIREELEKSGHIITPPNSFDDPMQEERIKSEDKKYHIKWKGDMLRLQNQKVEENDAILVLNYKKNDTENYIGGSVLLEMFKAWELNKKIFMMNPVPENMLKDEIEGLNPTIINGDLSLIK